MIVRTLLNACKRACNSVLRKANHLIDRCFGLRIIRSAENTRPHPLSGDRAIEWSWVTIHLPVQPSRVMDLGCVQSVLTGIASRLGHHVTSVDLRDIEYEMPRVTFIKGDVNELAFDPGKFDVIMNCSMIEHVGLEMRYGSGEKADGDLMLMEKLSQWLAPGGTMILTLPVGIDDVIPPYHRVYGNGRLPLLLARYRIKKEEYWQKAPSGRWVSCDQPTAFGTRGTSEYYALGLFVLEVGHQEEK